MEWSGMEWSGMEWNGIMFDDGFELMKMIGVSR